MNQVTLLMVAGAAAFVFAFAWDYTRGQLVAAREQLQHLENTRAADSEALTRLQSERDEISRRYETLHRELLEINDVPSVDYLNTAVPDSVRRLLER